MVHLEVIEDEHFKQEQPGPDENEEDFTDTDSEISNDSDYDPQDESFAERLSALRDMIPPTARGYVAAKAAATSSAVRAALSLGGKTLWVLSSSALLLGVPWALAFAEEQNVVAMEQEMKMREMGGEMLTGGADGGDTASQVSAALGGADAKAAL